jgi:methionine-S-sulfoxide reductase
LGVFGDLKLNLVNLMGLLKQKLAIADYYEKIISYEKILKTFFQMHDPTTLNSQGPDFGTQYRSEIFYINDNQKIIAEKVLKDVDQRFSGKVVTKISLLKNYCPAEEYHQKYLEKR